MSSLKFLDWGCGKGFISFLLQEMGARVTSCDVVGNGDSAFSQNTPIIRAESLEVVCLEHPYLLPFENESFDVVLSFGVLEHVHNDLASLRELCRILKHGGLFFCFFLPYCLSWTQRLAHLRGDFYHDRLYIAILLELLRNFFFQRTTEAQRTQREELREVFHE